ncbi:AvaI/BsoBI family type II restriction endonuclease [Algibacter mikhailovii]|uniref:AvaI/BsoBI family type II restriction endonuclease n=1 Tax=Algibacter mikhailovii TaxID=425498 RepID=UPI002494E5F5|nr:AvaI/BsoBI family type II restriction endonuclease [Algibacter mikhailovii]
MAKEVSYKNHLNNSDDLITTREETRAGFISMALEKNYLALPYVEEAKALKTIAQRVSKPMELLEIDELFPSLLSASGLSIKSLNYLTIDDQKLAIKGLIEEFLEPAGNEFVEELVYRYLLTKGDALGGQARNLAGSLGERKFLRSLLSVLNVYQKNYFWMDNDGYNWHKKPSSDVDLEKKIKAISWENKSGNRTLVLNTNVPIVKKNIDLSLLEGNYSELILKGKGSTTSIHKDNSKYIALGELKGGIDPAGADEHWKTANTALSRIRNSFDKIDMKPLTFFVGAAIESSMSKEIFNQLVSTELSNAGNLSIEEQLVSVCDWLIHQ